MQFSVIAVVATLVAVVSATNPANVYGQCGGLNWTGAKSCVSTATCTYINAYYSQCYPKP
ncbi:hypothetical protein H072_10807 [Dactylellina haptotyla CBS 200.50]|uniref:CBM1 domain-containing protein n=1 Tax=Dactylellina haptotyla (strain CBS 200.50) TaxID=1284197 RepID=S8A3M7_DACHA|nr:hypothetical protein H072_10807 [Dactylellina haptotyla CBS 200.50]